MAKNCVTIETRFSGFKKNESDFFVDLARLAGNPDHLDSCDIDHFKADLKLPDSVFSTHDVISRFAPHYGAFVPGEESNAYTFLTQHYFDAKEYYRYDFLTQHLSYETQISNQWLSEWLTRKKNPLHEPAVQDKLKKKALLYINLLIDPEVQQYYDESVRGEVDTFSFSMRRHIEEGNWSALNVDFQHYEKMDYLLSTYEWGSSKAYEKVHFWEKVDFVWNKCVRNLFALGAALFAGVMTTPAAVPAAIAWADFSDFTGEQLFPIVSWSPGHTLKKAAENIAYHAPFALAKGLSFQAGLWTGGGIYSGLTALEVTGDPQIATFDWKERAMMGGIHGGATLGGTFGLGLLSKMFLPRIARLLGPVKNPVIFSKKVRAETVVAPVEVPETGAKVLVSVEPVAIPSVTPPPSPLPAPKLRIVDRPREGAVLPERPPLRTPAPKRISWTTQKTKLAEESYTELHPNVQERVDVLMEQVRRALADGIDPTRMRTVKVVNYHGNRLCWEARILTPGKPRIYFEIRGTNRERTITILGYSLGENGQETILQRIADSLT